MKRFDIIRAGVWGLLLCSGCRSVIPGKKISDQFKRDGYELVWADEFNRRGAPDTNNWTYEKGFERNEEFQWYQEDNAWCRNGKLIIEARRETKPNPRFKQGSNEWRDKRADISYTSASIRTKGKRSWQFGRFIMRGKIDISDGLWPAWWTLGIKGRWPATGEIDIMEYYRNKLLANMVCQGSNGEALWYTVEKRVDSLGGKDWASKFHTWRMDWDKQAIALYVDDTLLNKVSLDKLSNLDGSGSNPFLQPHYMLLNLAVGGQQGGNPENTVFPRRFEVDYVRVYQKTKNSDK